MSAFLVPPVQRLAARTLPAVHLLATLAIGWSACLGSGTRLAAQDVSRAFDLRGVIEDVESGDPIPHAMIEIEDLGRRALTDAGGRFFIEGVEPGPRTVRVAVLGYAELRQIVEVVAGRALRVRLQPNPIVLEGLHVTVNGLESRRLSLAFPSRLFEHGDLALSSAPDLAVLLTQRTGAVPVPCSVATTGSSTCLWVRGREMRFGVWLDEVPLLAARDLLHSYRPYEFERVEFYPTLGQLRLYTRGYLELLAASRRSLPPLCIVC